ncbi:MAG TPA: MoaD/ThiS family protein [Anaerolineaceae bacterium]|jgi:sulfur carrier protein ThiS|nr:MoaD/ThiS family protein [Anaerolineaceae bacterium]HOD03701.1 MoaD/ThiS family protein [Anaerolineaceae bacterium]HQF62611.1 MoaD/ThiS family protein [Anaerolineaceae bacterium]HQH85760.1 MoaD/ThiS family protein [Anaerolineaceae bacterium]HQN44515.1 MoaD/ThiS family protein [Anaerolineaceae bacterium]
MSIIIKPIGQLKAYINGEKEASIDGAGLTINEALTELGIPSLLVALVMVNDRQASKDYCLQDGDQVLIMSVLGGG